MNKQTLTHPYNGILLRRHTHTHTHTHTQQLINAYTACTMERPQIHYAKWRKPVSKDHVVPGRILSQYWSRFRHSSFTFFFVVGMFQLFKTSKWYNNGDRWSGEVAQNEQSSEHIENTDALSLKFFNEAKRPWLPLLLHQNPVVTLCSGRRNSPSSGNSIG